MMLRVAAGAALLGGLSATWSVELDGEEELAEARRSSAGRNVIYAFWHSSLLLLAFTHRRRDVQVLVSQHRDGELIARILERHGYGLVRGSSRRGGVEALFRLATLLESGRDVAVTVDGPVGPRYSVHPGVVLLARRTGRPIVPVVATFDRGHFLSTWDALRVASPGARVRVRYGAALHVPSDFSPARVVAVQRELESVLRESTRIEEARWNRSIELEDVQDRRSYWERTSENRSPPRWLRGLARLHGFGRAAERALRPRPRGAGAPPWVVGVGNLESGGTGKTPCVIALGAAFAAAGLAVAVLTRGHGGRLGNPPVRVAPENLASASDETRLLYEACTGRFEIWVARRKSAGLERLRQRGVDLVLVDDAFQTAGLAVDRHLVLLDALAPFGNGFLLPAGRLREPPAALRRAHALLFTRALPGVVPPRHPVWEHLRGAAFVAYERSAGLHTPAGTVLQPGALRGAGIVALSGLGRPRAFEALARDEAVRHGFQLRRCVRIGDHAALEPELRKQVGRLAALDCSHILTTAKDAARLPQESEWNEPLLVLEQRLEIPELSRLVATLAPPAR